MMTKTGPLDEPAGGEKVGVSAVPAVNQKLAAPLSLSTHPARDATAFTVVVLPTVMGDVYTGEDVVGSVPFNA